MNIQRVQNSTLEQPDKPGTQIAIPKEMATDKLHEALELYIANQRLAGVKLTKPAAVVQILKEKLGIA